MKISIKFILGIVLLTLIINPCFAQKDYWKVFFPGYLGDYYQASTDAEDNLNMMLTATTPLQPDMFVSLDKNGYVVFQDNTMETGLMNFRDDYGNRYLVSYSSSTLRIRKYDPNGTLLFNQPNFISNGVSVGPSALDEYQFVNAASYLFTTNGKLAISGMFKQDTVNAFNYETINVFFVDTSNGAIINQYYKYNLEDVVVETYLQEDANGNINIVYFNEVWGDVYLKKFTQTGTLITEQIYGDEQNGITHEAFKMTDDFIYFGLEDWNYEFHVLKIGKTNLDTVYDVNTLITSWGIIDYFEANDSSAYLSYDNGSFGAFREYDSNGNLSCFDNSGNFLNYGYKFAMQGSTCFSARQSFSNRDTACIFANCSLPFDANTQGLIYGNFGSNAFPDDNYEGNDVLYIVADNSNSIPGVIGVIDARINNYNGKLYFDVNNNCAPDSAEPGLMNQLIRLDPTGKMVFTDQNGNYANYADSGTYSLAAIPFNNNLTVCPAAIPLVITDTTIIHSGNDFGLQGQPGSLNDLSVTVNHSAAITGFGTNIYITINNFAPLPASGVVSLVVDTTVFSFLTANPVPDSVVANMYYWTVSDVELLDDADIFIRFLVDSQAVAGTPFTTNISVANFNTESNLANNTDIFQGEVLSSFDPNDKNVMPKGYGATGVISPVDSILNYKIRFQNTGSYNAFKVVVIDTIDAALNLTTFQLRSTSHTCQVSFLGTNVLQFTFENIMLPDSNTNEALSHGFINYSIHTNPNLPVSTQITNRAHIYFDFNEPVATNQTINTIGTVGLADINNQDGIYIYPNPAQDLLNIVTRIPIDIEKLSVYDIRGRVVLQPIISSGDDIISVQLTGLQKGYYFLKAESRTGVYVKSFVKL